MEYVVGVVLALIGLVVVGFLIDQIKIVLRALIRLIFILVIIGAVAYFAMGGSAGF